MLKIEQRTYINDVNATDVNDDQLIEQISKAENEIMKLKAITTKSAAIDKRIAELEAGAKGLAEILDARTAP